MVGARLHVHMQGSSPSHRDAICRLVGGPRGSGPPGSPSPIIEALHASLSTVGLPVETPTSLVRNCLPYTMPPTPAPAARP